MAVFGVPHAKPRLKQGLSKSQESLERRAELEQSQAGSEKKGRGTVRNSLPRWSRENASIQRGQCLIVETEDEVKARGTIRAAARLIADAALNLIQDDPHQWSGRGCQTCKAVSTLVGRSFGCVKYVETLGIVVK